MGTLSRYFNSIRSRMDLPFLLFLLTVSSNKLPMKVVALILIFIFRPRFDRSLLRRIPLFYPALIVIALLQFVLINRDFSGTHLLVFATGSFYWLLCYAFSYQSYLFAQHNNSATVMNTISAFVVINSLVCLYHYARVCADAGTIAPFVQYSGKYGASTGDYILGLYGVPSYMNAIINSFFALYFIHKNRHWMAILAAISMFLSFANFINLIFGVILIIYALLPKGQHRRVTITLIIMIGFIMYLFMSPDNFVYMKKTIGLSVSNTKEIMPEVVIAPKGDTVLGKKLNLSVKYVNDSSAARQKILMIDRTALFKSDYRDYPTYDTVDISASPGKKIAVLQTVHFLKDNPSACLIGAGMGNFSSRLAFQFSGRDSSRLFMRMPKYAGGYYFKNHLLIYDSMRQLPMEYHSIKHFPNNFVSQLVGEYGIAGVIAFVWLYLLYFYRRARDKRFFIMLTAAAGGYLMFDYFFEFFNVMVVFEMLMFAESRLEEGTAQPK